MRILPFLVPSLLLLASACNSQNNTVTTKADTTPAPVEEKLALGDYNYNPPTEMGEIEPIDQPESYWREKLSPKAFDVLRKDGTERSFTSPLNNEKRAGVFTCAACGLPLFTSDTKFDSGTGWPSFYEPIHPNHIQEDVDMRYGIRRVEVSCARCGGHQGHVFNDGPQPTGLRYCINGVALDFIPAEKREPYIELLMERKRAELEAEAERLEAEAARKAEMEKGQ